MKPIMIRQNRDRLTRGEKESTKKRLGKVQLEKVKVGLIHTDG